MLHNNKELPTSWAVLNEMPCTVQGVRIDYALCSAGLVDKVVSCEIVSTPPKWSDHAALILGKILLHSQAPPVTVVVMCVLETRS